MTRKEQINFVRQKCIEANPDIVALKFGCGVKLLVDKIGDDSVGVWHDSVVVSEFGISILGQPAKIKIRGLEDLIAADDSHLQILGRPIRLADVLLAIKDDEVFVGAGGAFGVMYNVEKRPRNLTRWNLQADDLREQSEETVNFIYDLLQ